MPRYQVTVEAVIRKTYEIEGVDQHDAQNKAQEQFTVEPEGDEHYSQDVLEVCEMDEESVSDETRSYGPWGVPPSHK